MSSSPSATAPWPIVLSVLSTEETAETLGLSVPAVKSRLLRARLQLRERLSRYFKRKKVSREKGVKSDVH